MTVGNRLEAVDPGDYLLDDEFIATSDRDVRALARELRRRAGGDVRFAEAAFGWVRDEVGHSFDVSDPRVTLTANEVLEHRVGLCYQRLVHGGGHVLHGLVAIHLDGAWHRQDPRGNKAGVDAQFSLGTERLAWTADESLGEIDYPRIFAAPARCVIEAIGGATDILVLYDTGLPSELPEARDTPC